MTAIDKKILRKEIASLKKLYTPAEKKAASLPLWEKLEADPLFLSATTVLLYWSMEDEVYTHDFLERWHGRKILLLPCVKGDFLEIRRFDGKASLCAGERFGIMEPVGDVFSEYEAIDLIVVPGVAFDPAGNRLGRGKGYYDRILKDIPAASRIGVCFDFQRVPVVPADPWDVRMDKVLTAPIR